MGRYKYLNILIVTGLSISAVKLRNSEQFVVKSCGLVAADKVCYHHVLLLLGRLCSVHILYTETEYSSVISSLFHYLSAVLDTWMAKQRKSNLTGRVHVMKTLFTICENAKTYPNTNQESWKIF